MTKDKAYENFKSSGNNRPGIKPLTHIDEIIAALGDSVPDEDKYLMFTKWAEENGAIKPKLEYPHFTPEGEVGFRLLEDINFREAFVMVPYKLILSSKDLLKHEVLGPIYKRYRDCFDKHRQNHWKYNILIIALLYQMTLGKSSFWYPYLRILP